jgi:hypothetical protein
MKYLGQPTHADPTYANEMYMTAGKIPYVYMLQISSLLIYPEPYAYSLIAHAGPVLATCPCFKFITDTVVIMSKKAHNLIK